ncbi:TlpA disulfide reductase family protein [Amnibacterium sp.]|uniref:TlpA family protein disulfide reductase n=1 Tax=Amnibacterium sp. TaxID=1872496 RepID=UPI00261CE064|nr:TlpA disulfide reductase family protein [Amnibacterium sp.]MCU1473499.1 TlpA family protein disulfide reductase [Amnibacterium sp.]
MRRTLPAALALGAALLLSGCTQQGWTSPSDGRTIDGTGVEEWQHPTSAPVSFSGPTTDGSVFRSSAHKGEVLVVNFWYAGCGPCQTESPTLTTLAEQYTGKGVQFVGVNVRDEAGEAKPFEEKYGVPYPSILDQANHGAVELAFAGSIQPNATPTTLVIGRDGRVTARMLGQADPSILKALIDSAVSGRDT